MKLPWDSKAFNSTIISDVSCIRPFAKGLLSEQWEAVTHEAEIEAMAHLFSAVSKDKKYLSVLFDHIKDVIDPTDHVTTSLTATTKLNYVLRQVSKFQVIKEYSTGDQLEPHLLMHFWDCGGQPAFLEILPVFLTSRTIFLLHFDAFKDLNSKWQSVHHIDGVQYDGEEVNMSTLTCMLNWMACVHSHLMKYGADGSIPDYPRMFCIGTHGDLLTDEKKEQVRSELISHYKDKEYVKLISDTLIIDNTSSANHPNTTLYLEEGVYRNRVTFGYEDEKNRSIEHLTVTDQHDAIQINVHRPTFHTNPVPLSNVCQDILVLLEDSAKEVENILQNCIGRGFEELPKYSVSRSLRYICDGCPVSSKLHFLTPAKYQARHPTITCKVNRVHRPLTEKEKVWFTEKVETTSKDKAGAKSKHDQQEDQSHEASVPDIVSAASTVQKSELLFDSHFPQLCDAIATEHNITRVSSHCISLISNDVFDEAVKTTNPVYERAQALLRELRHQLKASSDQRQYLLNLISIFHKIKDPILSQIADSMKSEL
uniref:C-terminal of Roc (COR) domain-containing protein n=1 Tax=Amphimedon queenslandica TaxID=400682 RepID=A0A1X7VRJ6_AMPQE